MHAIDLKHKHLIISDLVAEPGINAGTGGSKFTNLVINVS